MMTKRVCKAIMIPLLMVMMAFGFNFSPVLGNDDPGSNGPFKTRNGKYTLMHDDEIAGFAAPPEGSTADHLVGWAFYPDEDLNLTETVLDADALKTTNSEYDFGLSATAVGRMHATKNDGIFVAYVDPNMYVRVAEYDPKTGERWVSSPWTEAKVPSLTWGYGIGRYLDCATGDFDNDGVDELIIAYRDGNYPTLLVVKKGTGSDPFDLHAKFRDTQIKMIFQRNLAVTTFHPFDGGDYIGLVAEGPGEKVTTISTYTVAENAITKKDSVTSTTDKWTGDNNSVDIAGGDFNGDGYDELAAIDSWDSILLLDYDSDKKLVLLHRDGNKEPGSWLENHIATGDLDGDGDDEAVSACAIWFDYCNLALLVYDFDNTLDMKRKFYGKYQVNSQQTDDTINVGAVDVAVGNFDGKKDIAMEVAVVIRTLTAHKTQDYPPKWVHWPTFTILIYDATAGSLDLTKKKESGYVIDHTDLPPGSDSCPKIVVAAGDFDGDSVVLGEPDHWQIHSHLDFSAVIAEPPKHIDYVKDNDGNWTELNVSRYGGTPNSVQTSFYTEYTDSNKTEITTTAKSTTACDWGVKESTEEEADFGFPVIDSINVNVQASAEQSYANRKETWNSSYASKTMGTNLDAVNDDALVYRAKNIDIWRYPIIGETEVLTKSGKKGQLYLQMTFPSDKKRYLINGSAVEWYQPVHENGNIFSYPWDTSQIDNFEMKDLQTELEPYTTGPNQVTEYVDWTNAGTDGKEVSTEKKVAVDSSVSVGGTIFDVKTKLSLEAHYDKTWGTLNSSETTNSKSKGISISKSSLSSLYEYQYTPLIYENHKTGILQVDHLVKPRISEGTVTDWWNENYNHLPDLALNLPFRWTSKDYMNWTFDPKGLNFKMMKGLFLLDSDGKPFGYVAKNTKLKKKSVTIKARVYNYSFVTVGDENNPIWVKFEAQKKEDQNDQWGPREFINTVKITSIPGFSNISKKPNWEYAAVTVNTDDKPLEEGYYYRFWVTVDPDNKITERTGHDNGETYANNTGFFGTSLYIDGSGSTGPSLPPADVIIDDIALSNDMPVVGEEVVISVWVAALGGDRKHVFVYFYDGHPDEGGKPFDLELIPYLRDGCPYRVTVPYKTAGKLGFQEITIVVENDTVDTVLTVLEKSWKDRIIDKLKGKL